MIQMPQAVNDFITANEAVLVYFSHERCSVCKVLKPKIQTLLETSFPAMHFLYVNTEHQPEEAASKQVFAVPTVIIFFEGKEYFRFSRNMSIHDLETAIERPYGMLFE